MSRRNNSQILKSNTHDPLGSCVFDIAVEEFEMWKNPSNGEVYVLELCGDKYRLITKMEKHPRGYGHIYNPPTKRLDI